jgi:hypothetical protein
MNYLKDYNKIVYHIDSADRLKGEIYNFRINLDMHQTEIKYVELLDVQIPNVIPPVRDLYNNKFFFQGIDAATNHEFTIDEGSWTITQILNKIAEKMNSFSNGVFSLTYHENTFKISIAGNGNFKLLCSNDTYALWNILGFDTTADKTGATSYEADTCFDLSGKNYIYLKSDIIQSLAGDKIMTSNTKVKNSYLSCLCKIPVHVSFGEIEYFSNKARLIFKCDHKLISNFSFFLEDNQGNPLKLTRDYSISLILYAKRKPTSLKFLYQRNISTNDDDTENDGEEEYEY